MQDSPKVQKKNSEQVTQETEKKATQPGTAAASTSGNEQVSVPLLTAVDGPGNKKTSLVTAGTVCTCFWRDSVLKKSLRTDALEKLQEDTLAMSFSICILSVALVSCFES